MHPVFLAALRSLGGWPDTDIPTRSGTIPAHVRVPADWLGDAFVIPSPEPETVKVRVAADVPARIRPLFAQLIAKPGSAMANVRESSPAQPDQTCHHHAADTGDAAQEICPRRSPHRAGGKLRNPVLAYCDDHQLSARLTPKQRASAFAVSPHALACQATGPPRLRRALRLLGFPAPVQRGFLPLEWWATTLAGVVGTG